MQGHGFEIHNVFCSAPGNLAAELACFHAVVGEVNQEEGMPHKILLAGTCLKSTNVIISGGDAAKENIRGCSFFVQILQDSWGPVGLYRELYDLAAACLQDEQSPMRGVAVFLKTPASLEAPPGAPVYRHDSLELFASQLRGVVTEWLSSVLPQARDASA